MKLSIKPGDLVLEVGSGNNPNPRSDILVDRYLYDNHQRAGGFKIIVDRPLIIADGYRLPFKDKTFDYVICSHILEHLENPEKFIAEITRVGKAGYIEVPADLSERIFGWDIHLWYCSLSNNRIILRKKPTGIQFGGFFHRLIAGQLWFRRFFEENENIFYLKYEWKTRVNLTVSRSLPTESFLKRLDREAWKLMEIAKPDLVADIGFYLKWMKRRIEKKAGKIRRRIFWQLKIKSQKTAVVDDLLAKISCLSCRGNCLFQSEKGIKCQQCGAIYEIDDVIPIMLPLKGKYKSQTI